VRFWRAALVAALVVESAAGLYAQESFKREDVPLAIDSGLAYLLADQNEDGSWGGTVNQTFTSGFANRATYRMWQIGTTGLSTRSMLELGRTKEHEESADRALDYLIAHAKAVRPAEWDVDNNWALVYGLDAIARALQHPRYADHEKTPALRQAGQTMLTGLAKYQSPRGGWGYYSSPGANWRPEWCTSFMTAVGVLSLIEAKTAGLEVDEKMYAAAVRALEYTHLPNGAFDYDLRAVPRHLRLESINQIQGSLGRIQIGHLALRRAGKDITDEDLIWGLEQFVKHHKFLVVARNKPIPHEAYYANAAYFYLFAHYYASQVLELLPVEQRAKFAPHIQAGILEAHQEDGAMWDFWIAKNTKPYGTSFGVMGLNYTLEKARD
jgi:hypothetical protein